MCSGGIPDLVDGFKSGIKRSIKTDGIVRAIDIVINCPRAAYYGNPKLLTEDLGSGKGSVTANSHQAFDPMLLQLFIRLLTPLLGFKFLAPCRLQYGTASLKDIAYR